MQEDCFEKNGFWFISLYISKILGFTSLHYAKQLSPCILYTWSDIDVIYVYNNYYSFAGGMQFCIIVTSYTQTVAYWITLQLKYTVCLQITLTNNFQIITHSCFALSLSIPPIWRRGFILSSMTLVPHGNDILQRRLASLTTVLYWLSCGTVLTRIHLRRRVYIVISWRQKCGKL